MASTESFKDDARTLAALGVPESVVGYVAEQVYPRAYRAWYVASVTGMLVFTLGVPTVAGFAVFRLAGRVAAARADEGYVVIENHGWSVLALAFGLFFVAGAASQWMLVGPFGEYCAIRGLLQSGEALGAAGAMTRWMTRKAAARVPSGEPHAFLREHGRVVARWMVWPGAGLTVLGLVLLPVDLGRYDVVDAAGVTHHTAFGASSTPWPALDHVETGCSVYNDNTGEHATGIYELVFANGDSTNLLMSATPHAVEMLGALDEQLRAQNVKVVFRHATFGTNASRAQDDGCPARVAAALGADANTLAELLRPTEP